ncbi:MAG: CopG family transcriptional regulator [Deltaproteobacteria bacterium]|nr:MAG: CopG family transcriptional regulator [Deltaproteobacteria bacterium]
MVRTQIQLTEQQARLLRELSRTSSEPIAALIRRAVDQFLITRKPDRSALYRQASTIVGKYKAGVHDISIEHDRYLKEAFRS